MTVRSALLQLLDEGPRHGYQLRVDFETRTGGIWPLNVGQVYTTLDRLARDGCVEEIDVADQGEGSGPPARTYRITGDGRIELKRSMAADPTEGAPPRDDLITKVLLAIGRGPDEAMAVVDEQRSALFMALQVGRRKQRDRSDPSEQLAHDALLTRIEADITWLDRCEASIRAPRPNERSS